MIIPSTDSHSPPASIKLLANLAICNCSINFRVAIYLTASLLSTLAIRHANAAILYGVQSEPQFESSLVTIDTDTLEGTVVGRIGFRRVGGLAFDNGKLFGLASDFANNFFPTQRAALLDINPITGKGAVIGNPDRGIEFAAGMSVDPTTGVLYATTDEGSGIKSDFLVTLESRTGTPTSIGDLASNALVAMDFDDSGQLWGIEGGVGTEQLIKIDKTNGQMTVVSHAGLFAFPNVGGLAIDQGGKFWAVNDGNELFSIDPNTGRGTFVGEVRGLSGTEITGLTAIPEPASIGLLVLGVILALGHPRNTADFSECG